MELQLSSSIKTISKRQAVRDSSLPPPPKKMTCKNHDTNPVEPEHSTIKLSEHNDGMLSS